MRQSAFNHIAPLPKGGYALYNFHTGNCMLLSTLSRDFYDNFELYGQDCPQVQELVDLGFLVDYDEHAYLRNRLQLKCGDTRKLRLTVCPTLQCNFACPYCFESARTGKMSEQVQDNLVAFTRTMLERYRSAGLDVSWFGGEPTLEPEIIRCLTERFVALCDELGIPYWASAITNGFLLNTELAELFDECHVESVQITLDGPDAATHDETRHLKGGQGSFERIMENIRAFNGKADIVVRCNVHKENAGRYSELQRQLLDFAREENRQISVYPGHMDGHGAYRNRAMDESEFACFMGDNCSSVDRFCFSGPICMAPKLLDMVVDEQGNLYKCLESVGRDSESFGNVADFDFEVPQSGNMDVLSEWLGFAWPDDEECMACPILPLCLGGCPQHRREGKRACHCVRHYLDEYVVALVEQGVGKS